MSIEVRYEGRTVALMPGDTVLEGLERSGIVAPSSCRAGVCQFCLMRVVDGVVPPKSQDGLKPSLQQSGHFLACVGRPAESLTCVPAHVTAFRGEVAIREIVPIGPEISRVRFARPRGLEFSPGQFVTLRNEDGLGRSYSIASQRHDVDYFDMHVRRIAGGRMSTWLCDRARPGDRLWAEGPKGDCMYYPGNPDETLSFIGTGTGMAPLHGIVRDALGQGHVGEINIYQGAPSEERLYLVAELLELQTRFPNVHYKRCLMQGAASPGVEIGDLTSIVKGDMGAIRGGRVYLCGDPTLVRSLRKELFLAGMSLKALHADPFVGTEMNQVFP